MRNAAVYDEEYVPNWGCKECAHHNVHSYCTRRIDHVHVRHAISWFRSYDGGTGLVCSDFVPKSYLIPTHGWTSFDDYWPRYVEWWLPYSNTDRLKYFTINGDTSVRYGVPLLDYVYGHMFDGNVLLATEKMYYKRLMSGIGYKLIREPIGGVTIQDEQEAD